ncbi:MAG: PLP-dependent transferase [Treponema sp.]|jgi:O-acetylhomoserine (thiol)-lyase|nr:PLP-dependent transferase [Treponema sp.]
MSDSAYTFDTLKIRAAYDPSLHNQAVSPPIYQTTAYEFKDTKNADGLLALTDSGFLCTRVNNPTGAVADIEALAALAHKWGIPYAGLESSPAYKLAQKYLPKGVPAIFSFGFKGTVEQSEAFLHAIQLWSYHVNVGDALSLIVNSPKTTHGELTPEEQKRVDIEPNLIRLSLGLEDAEDLIADLDQALVKVFGAS